MGRLLLIQIIFNEFKCKLKRNIIILYLKVCKMMFRLQIKLMDKVTFKLDMKE